MLLRSMFSVKKSLVAAIMLSTSFGGTAIAEEVKGLYVTGNYGLQESIKQIGKQQFQILITKVNLSLKMVLDGKLDWVMTLEE